MSTCSNCYTGCTSIVSDKCIKYTGLSNGVLGINSGDSLNYATSAILGFLTTTLDGTGIKYELAPEDMCTTTSQWLTDCTDINVIDITRALSKGICSLDTRIGLLETYDTSLKAPYTLGCLTISESSGTREVLQETVTQLCANISTVSALGLDLSTNYVAIEDVDAYIEAYLVTQSEEPVTGHASKMVPYTVVEYYGNLAYFDATGAGTGEWVNIYLCNGNNNTPDKRGRVAVGTTSGMGGGTFSSTVDPGITGNPTYSLYSTGGANTVSLSIAQIPAHTHSGTTNVTGAHTHTVNAYRNDSQSVNDGNGSIVADQQATATVSSAGAHSHTFTTSSIGGGGAHSNVQPVLACHYIMYIPA